MLREPHVWLDDIIESCRKIQAYTRNMTSTQFRADERTVDAVVRNLEVIDEATKQIPDSLRQRRADIPWRKIAGLRDVLIHAYFGIDYDIVWSVVEDRIPELDEAARELRKSSPNSEA